MMYANETQVYGHFTSADINKGKTTMQVFVVCVLSGRIRAWFFAMAET